MHPVITVIKERSKEPNYGQIYIFPNKRTTTTKTNRIGRQIKTIKRENIMFQAYIEAPYVTTRTTSHNNCSGPGFRELETTTHNTVSYSQYQVIRNVPDYRRS